jgi:anti-anti-sigma factor
VDFINSSGLGALVSILKDVRLVNGRMALCNLAPYVQEIFEITQLSNVFEICPTEKEAVSALASHAAAIANA